MSELASGCYRLAKDIRLVQQAKGGFAICAHPLRAVRLSPAMIQVLLFCNEQRSCKELAQSFNISEPQMRMFCEKLRWKRLLESGPMLPPDVWPSVSIIIPTYNRASQLERCLHSLFMLDYPHEAIEIIIVDDASSDETQAMLQRIEQEQIAEGKTLQVIQHQTRQGVARSRNTGATVTHHDLLAYIDSDCIASENWLKDLVPAFQDTSIAAVGGSIRAFEHKSMFGRYEDVRSSLCMGNAPQKADMEGPLTYLPTANLLVRRNAWQQMGGFAPLTFGEDVDFCRRLLADGEQILYLPYGIVYHDYRTLLRAFLNIRTSYASAEAALIQRHPDERRKLILPPEQATFAGLMIGGLWGLLWHEMHFVGAQFIAPRFAPETKKNGQPGGRNELCPYISMLLLIIGLILTIFGARTRFQKVQKQHLPIRPFTVLQATMRGHLAYIYHLCRHITRYYTLLMLLTGIFLPPLLLLLAILYSIVIGVDYLRLHPNMGTGQYALCSLLDDCAYEVGIVQGCMRHRTWKPIIPIIKRK